MGPLLVLDAPEGVEGALLGGEGRARGLGGSAF